jgi:hypothetical protein
MIGMLSMAYALFPLLFVSRLTLSYHHRIILSFVSVLYCKRLNGQKIALGERAGIDRRLEGKFRDLADKSPLFGYYI